MDISKELNEEVINNLKNLKAREEELQTLCTVLGNILTQNVELSNEDYRELKKRVSKACDENGKPICLREMRKRIQENFYGTVINYLNSIHSFIGVVYEQQLADHDLLIDIINKLNKED